MEIFAFIILVFAFVFCAIASRFAVPAPWNLGWLGVALLILFFIITTAPKAFEHYH